MWALGPNLLRFCIQSCFNTLPSPNNLVRWNILEDKSCPLCNASPCTLPHILSGCSFSLNNGRWNFRHDSVLKIFLQGLEELINEKKKVASSAPSFIKFVSPGTNTRKSSSKCTGLLDQAKDWVILADIGSTQLIFPPFIFPTSERPDIVLYSMKTRTVILIENTSGCEEKQSDNHVFKLGKYGDLVDCIRGNGWKCHLFAIEVSARGFNSTHVPYCLKSLGFPSRSVKKLLRNLSEAALKASYCIWLARKNKEWTADVIEWEPLDKANSITPKPAEETFVTSLPSTSKSCNPTRPCETISTQPVVPVTPKSTEEPPCVASSSPLPSTSKSCNSTRPCETSRTQSYCSQPLRKLVFQKPPGLINIGNTCYANAILFSLFSLRELWKLIPSQSISENELLKSLKAIMLCLNSSKISVNPKSFIAKLGSHVSKLQSQTFLTTRQHDASEVLGYVLQEVEKANGDSTLISTGLVTTYRCQVCGTRNRHVLEERFLNLPLSDSVSVSLLSFKSGGLALDKYCSKCKLKQNAYYECGFAHLPQVLVIRLERSQYDAQSRAHRKLGSKVVCDRFLSIGCDGATSPSEYKLSTVIHHSGTPERGHYTTTLLDEGSGRMWYCNDESVTATQKLDQRTAYILFYRKGS